ncbi:hypothetical protein LIER_21573 [Lithospermum erythrorhizon]|uniref:Uncharacterized protein n=1 Tax=Lithospermum erythrorhizon TaxID=34254 RepID=A0AAV3QQP4_LITER
MNPNGDNDHPQGNDALNLNNPADRHPENTQPNTQGLVNLGSGRTIPEGQSSRSLERAGLIQGLTEQIVGSLMDQLKERIPHLRRETPALSPFVREDKEKPTGILPRTQGDSYTSPRGVSGHLCIGAEGYVRGRSEGCSPSIICASRLQARKIEEADLLRGEGRGHRRGGG